MKNIEIMYFSGSGNTEFVARSLCRVFGEKGIEKVSTTRINSKLTGDIVFSEEVDLVIFAYPVYAFDAPSIMYSLARRLQSESGLRAGILICPGDSTSYNFTAAENFARKLKRKGFDVIREDFVVMPPNVFSRVSDCVASRLFRKAEDRVVEIAEAYLGEKKRRLRPPLLANIISVPMKGKNIGDGIFGRAYRVDEEKCTKCGICVSECPVSNISIRDSGETTFGWKCVMCMGCIMKCPEKAISHPLGFVTVERYDLYGLSDSKDEADCLPDKPKGYYMRLKKYLQE